jgi:hypothetical protein
MHPPAERGPGDGARGSVPRLAHPPRLDPGHPRYAEILAAHDEAVRAGQPGYLDPDTGLFVLTAAWLSDRGTCCASGCRHCPYDPPPPGRTAPGGGS